MSTIKFLHLSDLHIGDKHQGGLISQTKKVLFDDIDFILSKIESLDVVFFTGDFVQKGSKDEFLLFENFLIELWELFKKHGQNPYLLCVPGNHDLEREINLHNPIQKILTNWINEDDIRNNYFWTSPNDYHDFIIKRFENYTEWYKYTSIKKPEEIIQGYIPGDFYCTINVKELRLGIVGLNSTFLQLHGGDVTKKLGVYNKQIYLMFGDKYFEWLNQQSLSVLLTHQSPEWFEEQSFEEFNQEIYTKDSFVEHLCGHMHEPTSVYASINGYPTKNLFVSPSLFGLEYLEGRSSVQRIHGYTAGIYDVNAGKVIKTVWPRISLQTKSGLKITQNEEFNLEKDSSSYTEVLRNSIEKVVENIDFDEEKLISFKKKGGNLFEKDRVNDKTLVRTFYREIYSHMNIRLQERNFVINNLRNKNFCWISTAFGLGEEEFVGSILNESEIDSENCFSIDCNEVSNIEELSAAFKNTFSHNITQFFDIINSLNKPLVVFRSLNENLLKNVFELKEFFQAIVDFSPSSKFLIITEGIPERLFFDYIELLPLDLPAVKNFIEKSQELQITFTFLEYEKIHRISSGIPLYIDKVIEQLKFRPLSDLGDMEFETASYQEDNMLPKNLINEIGTLHSDHSKQGLRRFSLLSILSLLHNGETFERIRKYNPKVPFYPDDISYLLQNKLIETLHVSSIFEEENNDNEIVKVIKVPRMVRDYIFSIIDEIEKVEIYKQACNLYLGANWRNFIKLIKSKDAELDLIVHQNLQIAIRFILLNGIEKNNELEVIRMTTVSLSLISYFVDRGAYKDAAFLTEEILLLIKDVTYTDIEGLRIQLTRKLGENLRMTSIHERSMLILKSICDDETNSLSKKDRNDIRLSIAYGYQAQENKEEAIKYANLIKQNESNKKSELFIAAESVLIHFIEDEDEKLKKLNVIKNKAEKANYNILKANIILNICRITKDENQLKMINKIIVESKNDMYNKVRALVAKAEIVLNTDNFDKITEEDLLGLNISYSYCFYQRLQTLLNKCHRLAWKYWSMHGRFDQLLNLFRYSSFVWRLCGQIDEEQMYIDELQSNSQFIDWFKLNKSGINSTYYEQRVFSSYSNFKSNQLLI